MAITYPENAREHASDFRRYTLGAAAERDARALGYAAEDICNFARRAARYRSAHATHRFKNIAFDIDGDTILSVWHIVE